MSGFETFTRRMVPIGAQPYVTIQKRGTLAINEAAFDAMGCPKAVELLFDVERRIVGIHPVEATVEHAYPVRETGARSRSHLIAATAFTKYYEIETELSRRWPARVNEDGVLCIDLKTQGTVVTSNRAGPQQAR